MLFIASALLTLRHGMETLALKVDMCIVAPRLEFAASVPLVEAPADAWEELIAWVYCGWPFPAEWAIVLEVVH